MPVARGERAQLRVERRHQPCRQLVLGGAHGDPRRERRHRLVPDVLVDEVGRAPQRLDVHAWVKPEPRERRGHRLSRDAVHGQRNRVDRAGDQVCAGPNGLEPGGHGVPGGALAIEPDRKPARLGERGRELLRALRVERARRVVEQHACGAEIRQLARLLDERLDLAGIARAVDEPGVEFLARVRDRLARLAQVLHVVERVVQAEDLDPALGGGRDETPDEVAPDRP